MRVNKLSLKNYRNLCEETVEFDEKINVICGENAQGKTNLIEALWLLTGARSFRGAKDKDLVMFGCDRTEVCGEIEFSDRKNEIEIKIAQGKRLATVNGINRGAAPAIIGLFKAVIFSPEHLTLIKGGPENRRKLIDAAICQLKPTYPALLVRYNKVLRQRNVLLKEMSWRPESADLLDVWDRKTADYAGEIVGERIKYVKMLSQRAKNLYEEISGGEMFEISYSAQDKLEKMSKKEIAEEILKKLTDARKTDVSRGFTSVGAHRDELNVKINGNSAKLFGSQGQQRSCVIALKLAEAGIIGKVTGETPVILLDDILSELDENRQMYMFRNVTESQTFITGCVRPKIDEKFRVFVVKNGKVSKE